MVRTSKSHGLTFGLTYRYAIANRRMVQAKWVRLILVSTAILGIGTTICLFNTVEVLQPIICYSIAAIVSSYFFELEKDDVEIQ